jgi:hypothetical protein
MPLFVPQSKLDRLARLESSYDDNKRIAKAHQREISRLRTAHSDLIEDLTDDYEDQIRVLERSNEKVDKQIAEAVKAASEKHTEELNKLNKSSAAKESELNDTITSLSAKNKVLEGRVSTEATLVKRELDLKAAEDTNTRAAKLLAEREKEFEAKVKAFDARVKDEDELQYAKGYTDGVTDTLREGQELAETANGNVFKLAEKALDRETTVITTSTPATKSK